MSVIYLWPHLFLTFSMPSSVLFFVCVSSHSTERQVQAVLAVLLICISFEIAGDPFNLVNDRFRILGRLELSTLFVQWATMWCGSMIYASQDFDSNGFVIFLTFVVAVINIGMLVWLVVRLLMECVYESQEAAKEKKKEDGTGSKIADMVSDLHMSVQRWRAGRMTEEARQTRIRRRTIDAEDSTMNENPALQIEQMRREKNDEGDIELTSISNPMHRKKRPQKKSERNKVVAAGNSNPMYKLRPKKLPHSSLPAATTQAAVEQRPVGEPEIKITIENDSSVTEHNDVASGRRFSYNSATEETKWLDDEDAIEILADGNGRQYFYNNNTDVSTWLDGGD